MTTKIAVSTFQCMKKIPPGAPVWNQFNASFINRELDTRGIVDAIYSGHPVTTQHKNNWRSSENFICGQHLALDFDSEDNTSTIDYLSNDKFISKYGTFIHTTISHKPEAPRARVFFLLDEPIMQAKNYTLAAAALLWMFGTADRQCKDAARFFYGAPGCEFALLFGTLPLEMVKRIIKDYLSSGANELKRTIKKNFTVPTSQEKVSEALRFIPAWGISYDEWVEVLMGIHSEFGESGLSLAESWADGKPNEVKQKFKSFSEEGNTTGKITIGTVFAIAKKYGWRMQ